MAPLRLSQLSQFTAPRLKSLVDGGGSRVRGPIRKESEGGGGGVNRTSTGCVCTYIIRRNVVAAAVPPCSFREGARSRSQKHTIAATAASCDREIVFREECKQEWIFPGAEERLLQCGGREGEGRGQRRACRLLAEASSDKGSFSMEMRYSPPKQSAAPPDDIHGMHRHSDRFSPHFSCKRIGCLT